MPEVPCFESRLLTKSSDQHLVDMWGTNVALISKGDMCSHVFCLYLSPNDPWHTTYDHSGDIFINPYNLSMSTRWASGTWA